MRSEWQQKHWPEVTVDGQIYRRTKGGLWHQRTPHPGKEDSSMWADHDWSLVMDRDLMARLEHAREALAA